MTALDVALRVNRELKAALHDAHDSTRDPVERLALLREAVWAATTAVDCARMQDERDAALPYVVEEVRDGE